MHNSNQLDFSKFLIMESKNPTKSCSEWAALAYPHFLQLFPQSPGDFKTLDLDPEQVEDLMKNDWADFFYLVRNVAELTVDSPMDTLQDIFADIRDSEEKAFDCRFLRAKLGYLVKEADVAMAKLMAEIQEGEEYIREIEETHEELVNLEAKKKEKEQLNKEIQELMDRVKELDKDIQSLETKSKLKKDVAGATLI
ncbi:hypothetical protein TEA_015439 [Camellia sinensis var. sinensis]|uniref:Uncharacterized protein n=1 Tax=Camellia sinensis var. sinensis TaxID=542762 RepID=A0A4S4D3P3_CAMSN|nr:hypothetical protein TEA_015439 [Camellia sinensis var. sinensis]